MSIIMLVICIWGNMVTGETCIIVTDNESIDHSITEDLLSCITHTEAPKQTLSRLEILTDRHW